MSKRKMKDTPPDVVNEIQEQANREGAVGLAAS